MLGAMQDREATTDRSAQINRIAWLVTFVVPLVLTALLLTVKTAHAVEPSPSPVAFDLEVFEAEVEEVIELEPEEACTEAEEAFEMEELDEEEVEEICEEGSEVGSKSGATGAGSTECALRSANAHASTNNNRLKLTIGYTTSEPVDAVVEIKQGAEKLGSLKRHLSRSGVIRYTKQIDEEQRGKLKVRLRLSTGSTGCPSQRLVLFPR